MAGSISAFEAPALLDEHATLTRLDLYEALASGKRADVEPGLPAAISTKVVEFMADQHSWSKPIQHDLRKGSEDGLAIDGRARVFRAEQGGSEFLLAFAWLRGFQYSQMWAKAGVPPRQFVIQANWAMMLGDADRFGFVVLADRSTHVYWLERDEALVQRLKEALADMARRVEAKDPPPIDAVVEAPEASPPAEEAIDVEDAATRYRVAQAQRATTKNETQLAEHAYEAARDVLKRAIAPGAHYDHDGIRIHHNAKTGQLTEEKIDGQYF